MAELVLGTVSRLVYALTESAVNVCIVLSVNAVDAKHKRMLALATKA